MSAQLKSRRAWRLTPRQLLQLCWITSAFDFDSRGGVFNLATVVRCQFNRRGADVFVQATRLRRAGNGRKPVLTELAGAVDDLEAAESDAKTTRELARSKTVAVGEKDQAVIDEQGCVRLLEPVAVGRRQRVLVTILEEEPALDVDEIARLSEAALAEDWNRPEEDAAWSHLRRGL